MKMFNKKTIGIGTLAAILLIGIIAPSLPIATAQQGGGPPSGGNQKFFDCDALNPIEGGVIDMSVRVKDGKTCNIHTINDDITINGDVVAGADAVLQISATNWNGEAKTVTINGSVKSDGGHRVSINGLNLDDKFVQITGSVQIKNTKNGIDVSYAKIGGTAQFENNDGFYSINHSTVGGNVQVKDNTNTVFPDVDNYNDFSDNEISGNLQCSGNDPAPISSGGINTVQGKAQGQCASLAIEV